MRNLKKVLALVVAVAMLASFACVASAASFSDVAANASYADAVNLLSNLGIIKGYEDGTFKPAETVTRAEAATMMVRVLGLAEDVEQGDTIFTDVKADSWASGYVNVAVANGIVNGMGDGTFNPNGEVTYGQIVKMIVCALGYAPVAENNGGWNNGGYILAGSKAGFTKGVSGTADAAASRATVAQLIYNALEVELMDQKTFSTGINGSSYEVLENKTILSEYLGLEKVEGVITKTYLSNRDYVEGDNTVDLVVTKSYGAEDEELYPAGEVYSFVADSTDAVALLGYSVVAYVGENADEEDEMFAVAPKAKKNTMVTLDVELIHEGQFDAEGIVYFKSESAKSTTEAAIENVITGKVFGEDGFVVENNVVVNGFNYGVSSEIDAFDTSYYDNFDLLDNDGDGDFEFVFVTIPTSAREFVVEEVDAEDWVIEGEDENLELDYDDEDMIITIIKDGKVSDLEAVEAGDVVTVLDDAANVLTIYVSSVKVEGMVEEVEGDTYTIAGKEYVLSSLSYDEGEELKAGDEGIFYVNASGKIAFNETISSVADAQYAYLIADDESVGDFDENTYIIKVVTNKGEVEVITLQSKKITVDGETGFTDETAYQEITGKTGLVKIKTAANGELSAIYFPGAEDFASSDKYEEENTKEYNEKRGTYDIFDIAATTPVFHVDTEEEDLEEAITVTTVGDLFVDGESYKFTAYGEDEFEEPDMLVVYDAVTSVDDEAPVMVVTKVVDTTYDDEPTIKITGLVAGESVSVLADPEEGMTTEDVVKGNVILYATTAGLATDVKVLYTSTEDATGSVGTELGDILVDELSEDAVTVHEITEYEEATGSRIWINRENGEVFYFADEVNVTVVDYSGAKTVIKAGRVTDCEVKSNKTKTLFVKTALESEDVVTDVVVFVEAAE